MAVQISVRNQCIFVHVPKAAGSSIEQSSIFQDQREQTGEYVGGHETALAIREVYPDEFNHYFKFAFVRNPYSRLSSAFHYLSSGGSGNDVDKDIYQKYFNNKMGFRSFCMEVICKEVVQDIVHLRPQYEFICGHNMNVIVDFVGRQENFTNDSKAIFSRLKLPYEYRHSFRRFRRHYSLLYTPEMVDKISNLYELDFKLLDYPMEIGKISAKEQMLNFSRENLLKSKHLLARLYRNAGIK